VTPAAVLATLTQVVSVRLPFHRAENGDLVVLQAMREVPFHIDRVFMVRAAQGAVRGQHAHKACAQFLTCAVGAIEVLCDDGTATAAYLLDSADVGLLVPAGIWSQQRYVASGSVLTVLCDRPYDEHDYIRRYEDFLSYRQSRAGERWA
jgi:hypothetical protein